MCSLRNPGVSKLGSSYTFEACERVANFEGGERRRLSPWQTRGATRGNGSEGERCRNTIRGAARCSQEGGVRRC